MREPLNKSFVPSLSNSVTATLATLPGAPQSLAAFGGNGQNGLGWNPPSSNGGATITNYRVLRGTTSSNRQLVTSGGCANLGAALGCADTGLTNGQSYNYIVSAVNSVGQGPPSNSVVATPTAPTPAAPSGLLVTSSSPTTSTLTWADNSNNETGFKVERKTGTGGTYAQVGTQTQNLNFFNDSGLTGGTQYCYRVRATNGSLDSTYSNEKCVTTQAAATTPGAPQSFAASGGNAVVGLAWNPPSSNGGATITSYRVSRGTTSSNRQLVTIGGCANLGAVLGCVDTNVTNGQSYNYVVSAVNSVGQGPPSNSAIATPVSPTPTATTQAASNITTTGFRMNGTINPNGVSTQGYFEWGTSSTLTTFNSSSIVNVGSGTTAVGVAATVTTGICGTTYYFRVVAAPTGGSLVRGSIFSVTTAACSTTPLSITTTAFNPPTATVGAGYGAQAEVTATGGQTPYSWSATGFPNGMSINSSTGAPFGTPTVSGTFNVTVTVRDSSSPQQTASKVLVITVNPASTSLSITTTALNPSTATVGVGYSAQQAVAATGGQVPYSWSASGLPNGMGINSSSGVVSGTPTVAGTVNFTVTVSDSSSPQQTASKVLVITVADATPTPQKRPLIFIPGIGGSRLTEINGNELWPGKLQDHIKLSLEEGKSIPIIATDIINSVVGFQYYGPLRAMLTNAASGGGGYIEYDVDGAIGRRTTHGCDIKQTDANLFVFAYDWRKDIGENTKLLKDYVGCIQLLHPGSKIDILAHSTGGLIARHYIIDNPSGHQIDRVITIGSPWLGAPKAINVMETGDFVTRLLVKRSTIKTLAIHFPGVHDLLPSRGYITLGGVPFSEDGWDINNNSKPDGDYTYDQLVSLLNERFSGSNAGTNGSAFHDYPSTGNPLQDDWHAGNDGVKYYHILGVRSGQDTISNMTAWSRRGLFGPKFELRAKYDFGDGTVPRRSAERPLVNGKNFNAPGAVEHLFFAPKLGLFTDDDAVEHTGLTQNRNVHSAILCALNATDLNTCVTNVAKPEETFAESEARLSYYLRLSGVVSVTVTDVSGNSTHPLNDESDAGLAGVSSLVTSENSLDIVTPIDQTYTVTFRSSRELIDLELAKGLNDSNLTDAKRYLDLTLPEGTLAMLIITPQGIEDLRFDSNGDGIFETTVSPTVSVTGSAAQDSTPPVVAISATPQQETVQITLTASDIGSGLKGIFYSLDGATYKLYTAALTLNPNSNPVVYAYAEDNVANRSGLITFYPSLTSNQIDNAQFFARQHYRDFLNREPDESGLAFWTNEITSCGSNTQCQQVKRINVSAAFYLSIEFQQTGYLAYRAYKAAFGNIQGKPVPITREEMLADMQQIGQGVVVGVGDWEQRLEQNKRDYFDQLVTRERFNTLYPQSMTPEQFVDILNANAGAALSQAERDTLVSDLKNGAKTRAQVLRSMAEDPDLSRAESNKAFVLMQYYGYLRRNPDDLPDHDFSGWQFWLAKLNDFNGNFIRAEMVKAFLSSAEYRNRFGQ